MVQSSPREPADTTITAGPTAASYFPRMGLPKPLSAVFSERPARRLLLIILRPALVFMRARKPMARLRLMRLIRLG